MRDEAVRAIVRVKAGQRTTKEELTEFCRARMAKFKVPEFWYFQEEEFPKTSIGKIRKNIVRGEIHKDWAPDKYR